MNSQKAHWFILIIINIPVYLAIGRMIFKDWGSFLESLRLWSNTDWWFTLEKEWKEVISTIITPSKSIKFDDNFIKSKVFGIFAQYFVVKNNQVLFIAPTPEQEQDIYHNIDAIRSHIKSQNGVGVKLLLSK